MHTQKRCPLLLFILLTAVMGSSQVALSDTYTVSITPTLPEPLPQIKASENAKLSINTSSQLSMLPSKEQAWQAVFNYLGQKANIKFKFEPANSQLDFELKLAKGYYDFAYTNPLQFIAFNDFPGYKAVVKRKAQPIRGIIVVKKTGPISSLTELRDAIFAFPGTLNFPASIVLRESLNRLNVNIIPQFLASQKHVYSAVANGSYIAGGGSYESFEAQASEVRNALRIIWDSPGYTPYAFSAHPRVPFFTIIRLQRAMVGLVKHEEGKALLPDIFVDNGFEVARDSDWHDARLINLEKLNGASVNITAPKSKSGKVSVERPVTQTPP